MKDKRELFATMDNSYNSKIKLRDEKALHVEGIGYMEMHIKEGINKVNDIYHTLNLKHILLSVGQIMENNYKILFEEKNV